MKSVATIVNGYPFDSQRFSTSEGYPLVRIRDLNSNTTEASYLGEPVEGALIDASDLLIGMDGDFNIGRWLGRGKALLNQRMCCVRGYSKLLTRYLEYALREPLKRINGLTYATTVKHLSSFQIERIRVALPDSESELEAVVSFLDRETAKIDALVAEQRRLIELLKEKRQAIISHAVTKGLNRDVPMKPSGNPWIGDVPTHWEIRKVKHVAAMESGHTPDKKVEAYWEGGTIQWVSLNDTGYLKNNDYISETTYQVTEAGIANSSAHILPEGAVVFSRDATIGRCAITTRPMAVSQHFIAWICGARILPEYLLLRLKSMGQELDSITTGATVKTIGMPEVRTLQTPVPSLEEQTEIAKWVTSEQLKIAQLIEQTEKALTLLTERRSALITAAVTGQIDVRQTADLVAA